MAGNATVELYDGSKLVTFEIWIQSFSTASNNEFMTQQVRDKLSWIPIRRAEMFLNFTAIWPLITLPNKNKTRDVGFEDIDPADGFAKMNKFQETIYAHQKSIVNGVTSRPMVFTYHNNSNASSAIFNKLISTSPLESIQYDGWIQNAEKMYIRFQNMFTTNYTMNIVTKNVSGTPNTTVASSITYAPTASDQNKYGSSWINIATTEVNNGNGGTTTMLGAANATTSSIFNGRTSKPTVKKKK